jgi:DNA-binding MarR family transcriptional regulator
VDDAVVSREIAVLLVQSAERLKADFARSVAPLGLSVPAARALLLLDEPVPMRVLSDRLACDQSYITRIADELEQGGLVQRTRGTDRRIQLLELTDAGTRIRDVLAIAVSAENRVLSRLGDADRTALREILQRLMSD